MANLFVHNSRGQGAKAHYAGFVAGLHADRSPYGFHLAENHGYTLTLSEDFSHCSYRALGKVSRKLLGFDIGHALANRTLMRDAELFWTMNEREGFAVAALMEFGIIPSAPIITSTVWIFDEWERINPVRRWIMTRLSRHFAKMTFQSKAVEPLARSIFPDVDLDFAPFGINTATFKLTPPREPRADGPLRIFAGGNDRTRDWATLVEAFAGHENVEVDIYCGWMPAELVEGVGNIHIVRSMTIDEFVSAIRTADIAAVPMRHNVFSGITFALNCASLGTPILCSRTGGVPSYFAEDEAIYAEAEDALALRAAAFSVPRMELPRIAERAQRRFQRDDYTTSAVIGRFATYSRQLEQTTKFTTTAPPAP